MLVLGLVFLIILLRHVCLLLGFLPDYSLPESMPGIGAVQGVKLKLHHVLLKVSPSGRRQHYLFPGRHLAAAAGINPVTRDAIEIRLVAPSYHCCE